MDVAELQRQVEYKFAPVPLLAVQALANTFAFEPDEERLLDADTARRWLVDSDLATDAIRIDGAAWRKLVDFRTAVRGLIDATQGEDRGDSAAGFAAIAAEHPAPVAIGDDARLDIDLEPVGSVDELISQFVGIVLRAQLVGEWERLKICASDECRWSFYDGSRNRGGTWCSMETCGNKLKNRTYRARQSASS